MYFKIIEDNYIFLVGEGPSGEPISKDEYETILSVIKNSPANEPGYVYRLRTDLTWEKTEVPPINPDELDATDEDYIDALEELGVNA